MTLEKDFLRLHFDIATGDIPCKKAGIKWPPPERLYLETGGKIREATDDDDPHFVLIRRNYSKLTDEEADHPNIARGAEYTYA